jgi:hypothetical protein
MIKYLRKRKCPRCFREFVVILFDRSSRVQSINGFCGDCDHSLSWHIIHNTAFANRSETPKQNALR